MTLEELKALYKEKGATTQRITQSGDAGDVIDYLTNDLGEGFRQEKTNLLLDTRAKAWMPPLFLAIKF